MKDTLGELVKIIPKVRLGGRVFRVTETKSKNGVINLVFTPINENAHPPYFLRAIREGNAIKDVVIGFALPKKLPPKPRDWALYYYINARDRSNMLAHVINDGERWGVELNRFTRDGFDGPPEALVRDLAHAVKNTRSMPLSAKEKTLLVKALAQVGRLVERDAVGKFAYGAAVLPYSPAWTDALPLM